MSIFTPERRNLSTQEGHARILRRHGIRDYTLEMDATQIEAQKREACFTDQKVEGYLPMRGFLFESKLCLLEEFREGNESPGAGAARKSGPYRDRSPTPIAVLGFLSFLASL